MKVIFLDVDGVLNNQHFLMQHQAQASSLYDALDPACLEQLKRIVEATGAHIVVSST